MKSQKIKKKKKKLQQNNSETVENQNDKDIPKDMYIYLEEKQKIVDNLRSIIIV